MENTIFELKEKKSSNEEIIRYCVNMHVGERKTFIPDHSFDIGGGELSKLMSKINEDKKDRIIQGKVSLQYSATEDGHSILADCS